MKTIPNSLICIFIISLLILLSISQLSHPAELVLLKEVYLQQSLKKWRYAPDSGDLITVDINQTRIAIYNNSGDIRWQWGPNLRRYAYNPDISTDGRTFIFQTCKAVWEDERLHYYRDGKEIWNKVIGGLPYLSPDGNLIAVVASLETGDIGITLYNSKGEKLWNKHSEIKWKEEVINFTDDSNFLFSSKFETDPSFYVFDKKGNILFYKKYAWGGVLANGKYMYLIKPLLSKPIPEDQLPKEGLYDIKGNFLMENYGILSNDAKTMLDSNEGKVRIVEFPSQVVLKEYAIDLNEIWWSWNGRFILGHKKDAFNPKGEVLNIIDTETNTISLFIINGKRWQLSSNGRYLISKSSDSKYLYFYKLNF
jgi:hypothetical protein